MIAWRFAPHNHVDQADIGRQSLRLFRPRGLSAAPLDAASRDFFEQLIEKQKENEEKEDEGQSRAINELKKP